MFKKQKNIALLVLIVGYWDSNFFCSELSQELRQKRIQISRGQISIQKVGNDVMSRLLKAVPNLVHYVLLYRGHGESEHQGDSVSEVEDYRNISHNVLLKILQHRLCTQEVLDQKYLDDGCNTFMRFVAELLRFDLPLVTSKEALKKHRQLVYHCLGLMLKKNVDIDECDLEGCSILQLIAEKQKTLLEKYPAFCRRVDYEIAKRKKTPFDDKSLGLNKLFAQ